jgi:hypothetical protein
MFIAEDFGILDWSQAINPDAPLNSGLVSWWMAGEDNPYWGGPKLFDLCPWSNNHGTLTNFSASVNPWSGQTHPGGRGSLKFDGSDDLVDTNNAYIVDAQRDITISAWVYITANGSYPSVIQKNVAFNTTTTKYGLYCTAGTRQPVFNIGSVERTSATALTLNQWTHIIAVSNASGMFIFTNGVKESFAATSAPTTSSDTWKIGCFVNASGMWPGNLNDIRVWNRGLSDGEAVALYQASRLGYPNELNWITRPVVGAQAAAASGGGQNLLGGIMGANLLGHGTLVA